MTDQKYDSQTDQSQQQQSSQHSHPAWPSDQSSFDASFFSQIASQGQGLDMAVQVVSAYFDNIEQQNRTTRRIGELWAQQLLMSQNTSRIVAAVAPLVEQRVTAQVERRVIDKIKSNPELLKT